MRQGRTRQDFTSPLSTYGSLQRTQEAYYDRYRFAEVFAHIKRAPESLVERIADLPGVEQAQTRVVEHATLDVPGFSEPAVGRLISIREHRAPGLNDVYLRSGRHIEIASACAQPAAIPVGLAAGQLDA